MAPHGPKGSRQSQAAEVLVEKSPAEFFAEHQAIAGFDNLGKSLYTSIRELVENGLDACESIGALPSVTVELVEYTEADFNRMYIHHRDDKSSERRGGVNRKQRSSKDSSGPFKNPEEAPAGANKKKEDAYFKLVVTDNGCGMQHSVIPSLLGKVLSGSKHGVRQTRGKYGLGAKMALIYSKKSTGQPIRVKTGHRTVYGSIPSHVSECVLDIDISTNEPSVVSHIRRSNAERWAGTQVEVVIAGNWTTYKSRVVNYWQQLAIITPYADLDFAYRRFGDDKKSLRIRYDRRSEQMPPPAQPTLHHPSGVNNLVLQQLIQRTKERTLSRFLLMELYGLSPSLVKTILSQLGLNRENDSGDDDANDCVPQDLSHSQITRLAQVLRSVSCKGPDTSVLSPLGEYNLNLGITKVLEPDLVATCRDRPGAFEGHGFVVEAAVSLGGKSDLLKEGIQVYRFANRIPLLFEGGADVSTRVAGTQIRWANYKIDPRVHRIGVFVSIVSTKIPFKGTSKEYIGDDATELQQSVKRALQSCCQQLRVHLVKRQSHKSAMERQSKLQKYIPDVSRSLYDLLDAMKKRRANQDWLPDNTIVTASRYSTPSSSLRKRLRVSEEEDVATASLLRRLGSQVTRETFASCLKSAVQDAMTDAENETEKTVAVPVYLVPLYNLEDPRHDIVAPLFRFRPIQPVKITHEVVDEVSKLPP